MLSSSIRDLSGPAFEVGRRGYFRIAAITEDFPCAALFPESYASSVLLFIERDFRMEVAACIRERL
jgi:hypothetical protein